MEKSKQLEFKPGEKRKKGNREINEQAKKGKKKKKNQNNNKRKQNTINIQFQAKAKVVVLGHKQSNADVSLGLVFLRLQCFGLVPGRA